MFSVVIPLYNKKNTVMDAVSSVFKQTFQDFEIIIINDGSTDGGEALFENFPSDKLQIFNKPNSGVSDARNLGIKRARFNYICFLDADDKWLPNHLEVLYALINKYPDYALYSTICRIIKEDGSVLIKTDDRLSGVITDYLGVLVNGIKSGIHMDTICVKRSVFDEVGYFSSGEKISEDISIINRIALCYDIVMEQTVTTEYHRENSTASRFVMYNEQWQFPQLTAKLCTEKSIPINKQNSLRKYLALYQTQICIQQCFQTRKIDAWKTFYKIRFVDIALNRFAKMLFCLLLPSSILKLLKKFY